MSRLTVFLLALSVAGGPAAADRLIPVITGTIGDRTYRTTIDLRSPTTEECRFEVRVHGGATLHSVEPVEAGKPRLLDEFAGELRVVATTVRVSCTGSVGVHSRIHESANGGATYDEGPLFRAVVPEPLIAGQTFAMPVRGDFVVAEVHGAPARVIATLTATSSNRIADREYDLAPFGGRSIGMAGALRSLGPIEARFVIAGEGRVIILPAVTDPAFANRASRAPAEIRARLNAQAAVAAAPPPQTTPSIKQQLLISSFKAAPFHEPVTGLVLMRDRWYDPPTGSFLTPDPEGYRDSSNLYSYCAGDPVNCSDPTGRHRLIKRKVNGLEFELLAPDADEVRRGELGMSGSFINPFTGKRESFSWDQHESELLLMQARWGNPLMQDAFAQFFGMAHDEVDISGARLYWNSLWHHKTDIALSAGFTVAMLAPRPPVTPRLSTTPRVNLMRGGVTPPTGATSTLVEGGGLAAHERAGGHLIEKHVGQTPAQLRARLAAEPHVPAVSTFMDRSVAESAVNTTLQANQAQISAWMLSASPRLLLNHALAKPTGLSLARGAVTPTTVSGVRLVLVKDATMPMGYRVQTGFPTP